MDRRAEKNLQIDDIEIFGKCIRISWSSSIGFGEYDIVLENNGIHGYSECMDTNEDKAFIKKLLELFVDKLIIEY
jgi:hypothetical protein